MNIRYSQKKIIASVRGTFWHTLLVFIKTSKKCLRWVSNPVPSAYKADALPFELKRQCVPF